MKKEILIFSMASMVMFSCGSEGLDPEPIDYPDKPSITNTLKFNRNNITIEPNSLNQIVTIDANINYEIKEVLDDKNWLRYELSDNQLNIIAQPNNEEITKKATFIIYNEKEELSDTLFIVQQINKERVALIQIYKALNGDQWTNNDNWCSDKPLSEWSGILAEGDMKVTRLWLSHDAFIEGEIPTNIVWLKHLKEISFEYTQMHGILPDNLGELSHLKRITLGNCNFSGKIPETLSNCKLLEYVDLSNNKFEGAIPDFIFQCPNLYHLQLDNNNFESFYIKDIPVCQKLKEISISNNKLSTPIPSNLFKIKGLSFIYASNNHITGTIPPEIGEALNLTTLLLYKNNLTGKLPQELVNLKLLETFSAYENYLDISNTDYLKGNPNYKKWIFTNQKN